MVSPQVTLFNAEREKALIARLVDQGLFPAVSGAEPEAADHSVIVEENGRIRPIHAVASLHLRGRLSKLADETPEGTWKLGPGSVRRAAGNRNKATQLLDELAKLHRGTLPRRLVDQIKAWGGYYGEAAVETLSLIEFRDPDVLDELRQDPDLGQLLAPFPVNQRALACVPADRLPEVKESLVRIGVKVRDGLWTDEGSK